MSTRQNRGAEKVDQLRLRDGGRLAGRTIAILMESDHVEPEVDYYQRRFAEEGARIEWVTRLWGQPSMTFTGHEYGRPVIVDGDLEAVDDEHLRRWSALVVPSGMVSDRLRYAERAGVLAPAVQLLQRAFAEPAVLKGIICHGMWLVAPAPELVAGRKVVVHNNLIGDARNMGAEYVDQDVVIDGDLVTGRTGQHAHVFSHAIIDQLLQRRGGGAAR
jgi:protease I